MSNLSLVSDSLPLARMITDAKPVGLSYKSYADCHVIPQLVRCLHMIWVLRDQPYVPQRCFKIKPVLAEWFYHHGKVPLITTNSRVNAAICYTVPDPHAFLDHLLGMTTAIMPRSEINHWLSPHSFFEHNEEDCEAELGHIVENCVHKCIVKLIK